MKLEKGRSYKITYKNGEAQRIKKIFKDQTIELDGNLEFISAQPDNGAEMELFKQTLIKNGFNVK